MNEKLKEWCKKNNAIQRCKDAFWLHFKEFKRVKLEGYSKKQIKNIELFVENLYYEIHIEESNRVSYAVSLYILIEDESVGNFKLTFNEEGAESCYEIW